MTRRLRRCRRGHQRHLRGSGERGSLAIELAFLAPVVLLVLALIWAYGRVAWANGHLDAGVRDATRVATQARSMAEAEQAAWQVVHEATAPVAGCQDSLEVQLSGSWEPGATITVTAGCSYQLGEIGLPGAPGTMNPTTSFSSVLDRYRSVQP